MKVQQLMEIAEKYINAYQYYKQMYNTNKNMTRDFIITTVARMFLIPNIKDFHTYVLKRDKNEKHGMLYPK